MLHTGLLYFLLRAAVLHTGPVYVGVAYGPSEDAKGLLGPGGGAAQAIFGSLLLLLIEANYPKTYQAERRKFGVLKESYS